MIRSRVLAPLALLGLLAGTAAASAQPLTPERVQVALDRTDRRIEQAELLVTNTDNDRARAELDAAVDLQGQAKSAFGSSDLALAMKLTLAARGHADRAIAIVRGLPDPDRVVAQLERTRDLLERARDRIEECDQDRARAMLRTAFEMQDRAEGAARDGRYLAALQLTLSARERGLKALRLCHLEENLQAAAERALRRTDQVIQRAHDAVSDHAGEPARQALARAVQVQTRARGEFRDGHFAPSLRLTQVARASAFRAIRLTQAERRR